MLDLGTGAGFPGLVLKICEPSLELALLEPSQKKVTFLHHIIRGLGLKGVEVIQGRAEDKKIKALYGGRFDLVISRALGSLETFITLALPFIKEEGRIVAMKGPKGKEEWEGIKGRGLGVVLQEVKLLSLPWGGGRRSLLIFSRPKGD